MGVLPAPALLPILPVVQMSSQVALHTGQQQQWATSAVQRAQQQMYTANSSSDTVPAPLTVTPAVPVGLLMGDSLAPPPEELVKKIQANEVAKNWPEL